MTPQNNTLYETAKFYKDKQLPIHIWLIEKLPNGKQKYRRGLIISVNEDSKDRIVIQEEEYGEMLLFFDRIDSERDGGIVPREMKGVKDGRR